MSTDAEKPIRFGITFKIALLSTVLVCVTAATIGYRFYTDSKKIVLVHELQDLQDESNLKGRRFVAHFATLREDALRLARLPEIRKLVSLIATGESESEQAEQKRRLVQKFLAVAKKSPFYFQIRLIGVRRNGMEIVRIEKPYSPDAKTGKREWKKSSHLLPKAHTKYFKHIIDMDLQPEKAKKPRPHFVYLSDINLNREDGDQITLLNNRPMPTIRASVPIVEPGTGKLFGIIVINMNVESAFNQELRRSTRFLCFLTNHDGDYLLRPDKVKEFMFDKNTEDPTKLGTDPGLESFHKIRNQPKNAAEGKRIRIQDDKYFGKVLGKFFAPETKEEIERAKDAGLRPGVRPLEFTGHRVTRPITLTDYKVYLLIVKPKDWEPGYEISAETVRKLQRSLDQFSGMELLLKDPFFRIPSRVNPKASRLVFRSSSEDGIEEIADHFRTEYADEFVVQNPFLCQKFAIQFFRLYYDPDHPERYMGLVVAASHEEILADMDQVRLDIFKLVILLIAGATAIAFLFSRLLTRPLKVLTRATKG
ncbi:MAG: hypothetical protein IID45_03205, partial [Planctomycetes bacterium]|nr:hypothetical protein [Planctomycetota bacterium]